MKPASYMLSVDKPRFENAFDSVEEAEEVLEAADIGAKYPRSREFIDNLYEAFEEYGMRTYLSYEQYKWLLELSGDGRPKGWSGR